MSESIFESPAKVLHGSHFWCTEEKPFVLSLHKHDLNSELLFVEEGEGIFTIDGVAYPIKGGMVLIYQRGVWHEERSTRYPFKAAYLSFSGLQLKGLPSDFFIRHGEKPVIELREHAPAVKHLMSQILTELSSAYPESQTTASHFLGILLARLAQLVHYETPTARRKQAQPAIMRTMSYMEENYREPITLAMLAQAANMNEYHLAHLFKAETGVSPIQFLIRCRMEVAKRYLLTTRLPVAEISELVGYRSETSFHNAFKRVTGMTPGKARELS